MPIFKILKPMSERDAIYLAGFFDGEGCVGVYEKHPRQHRDRTRYSTFVLSITLSNTNQEVLEYIKEHCGGRISIRASEGATKLDGTPKKPCWRWDASNREAAHILQQLLPYLIVKREQVLVGLRFAGLIAGQWSRRRAQQFPGIPLPMTNAEIAGRRAFVSEMKSLKH